MNNPLQILDFCKDGTKETLAEHLITLGYNPLNPNIAGYQLNTIFHEVIGQLNFLKSKGLSYWQNDKAYYATANEIDIIRYANKIYFAKQNSNTVIPYDNPKSPEISPTFWGVLLDLDNAPNDTFALKESALSVGSLLFTPFSTTPPLHIILIGQELLRTDYQDLFDYVQADLVVQATKDGDEKYKTAFGDGDGSTTFTVGDYRDVFFRAVGTLGETLGNWKPDELENHSHTVGTTITDGGSSIYVGYPDGNTTRPRSTADTGGSETRPQAVSVNVFMRY